ncbi:hypothetical protein [Paludisphaera mucosa]|uniref:ABC-2 type transporter domain-containing protein n=1 Tax=Paludisphaera mucosa TaxID=3030827 RepID=A0ABT6FGU1_9BACT|nr:hypothetical protein [Paludisphaera mucosa]MDG3006811.1 hypothetical protein [Paludisphaera mucosa]
MSLGMFLRREYVVSIGRGSLFRDRLLAAALTGSAVLACLLLWDWNRWDRTSIAGASSVGRVAFGLLVVVQVGFAVAFVLPTARAIASERDGRSLDDLLATRLSSSEIVLGVMAAGLFRFANALAATIPVSVLIVYLGGVDPRYALLAFAGSASTALLVAAMSVAASVESRTAGRAARSAFGLLYLWFVVPALLLTARGFLLPAVPDWLLTPLLWALDGGPLGPAGSGIGILPRPWGIVEAVARMAAIQVVVAGALTAWAIRRLRPVSRALYDLEGRIGLLQALRAASRSRPRRRLCGDDPVFWNEAFGQPTETRAGRAASRGVQFAGIGAIVVCTWWFAGPAFRELADRGYGPSAEAYRMPEMNPLPRVIAERLVVGTAVVPAPGRARLEFNLALRQFTALVALGFAISIFGFGVEGVARERRRDTWTGLLATPLSGRDIIRGKVLGALWKARSTAAVLLGLWTVGLAAGAVHPLGLAAALFWMGVSGPLYGMLGVSAGLRAEESKWPLNPAMWARSLAAFFGVSTLLTLVPMLLAGASLFTYEDVQAAARSGPFPPFDEPILRPWIGARTIGLACLGGTTALLVEAVLFAGTLTLAFDALVGRPARPREDAPAGAAS